MEMTVNGDIQRLAGSVWQRVWVGAKKSLAVEMIRVLGDPHFGFPGNLSKEGLHRPAVFKGSYENKTGFATCKRLFEFLAAFSVHGPRTGDGLDQQ